MSRLYRVLLVDDMAALRALVQLALERDPAFVVVASAGTGDEAARMAREHQPDLVLLDLAMPECDGLTALPRLRFEAPGARVVVLSGFEAERMGPAVLRLGADAYLEKGVPAEELPRALRRLLEPDSD